MSAIVGGVGGAALGAGIIAGVGGIAGGIIQGNAAENAAQTQADAANRASQLQYQMYEEQRGDQAPWRQAGSAALSQMSDPYFSQNFTAADMANDPGYQFRMNQGMAALQASAAARGGLLSGNALQAITDYGQNYASNEYQNAYNRFTNNQTNRFNRLASIAGLGQTANGQTAAAGQNYANQAGQNMMGAANAAGAAQIASGNMWGNTLNSLGSGIGNSWMQYQSMNNMNNLLGGLNNGGGTNYATASIPQMQPVNSVFGQIGT